jgi:hypothetical protein
LATPIPLRAANLPHLAALIAIVLHFVFESAVYVYFWEIDGWYAFIFDVDKRTIIEEKYVGSKRELDYNAEKYGRGTST